MADRLRSVRAESHDALLGSAPDKLGISFEAQAEVINERFRLQMTGLRRRFRAWEIPAVVRGLQDERRLSLRLLRERHDAERFGERQARKRRSLPPPQGP